MEIANPLEDSGDWNALGPGGTNKRVVDINKCNELLGARLAGLDVAQPVTSGFQKLGIVGQKWFGEQSLKLRLQVPQSALLGRVDGPNSSGGRRAREQLKQDERNVPAEVNVVD
jgi:hypothetical protein